MTKNDLEKEVGRAFLEQRDLTTKVECLKLRLTSFANACTYLVANPLHEESLETMKRAATDPREDWAELQRSLVRLDELAKILHP